MILRFSQCYLRNNICTDLSLRVILHHNDNKFKYNKQQVEYMQAFKFKYNRVRRSYTGGAGIDHIRQNTEAHDGEYPEEWIASTVTAIGRPGESDDAGISIVDNESEEKFSTFLAVHAIELLGGGHVKAFGHSTGFLMKLLDSAIRLPVQAHPDNNMAMRLFNSPYGKTEAWLILATRPVDGETPYLLAGFNEKLEREVFIKESIAGKLEHGLEMMHKVPVKPGDVFMIRGGLPHALGPGLTVIEIMEPSDWIVLSEQKCGNILISDSRRFNGLEPEAAMSMFDFSPVNQEELEKACCMKPQKKDHALDCLLDRAQIGYFGLERLLLNGSYELHNPEKCCRAGIVIDGDACIDGELSLKSGDAFFLPACNDKTRFCGDADIIFALPPHF
jgi:mannose-6-phosphate isomerase